MVISHYEDLLKQTNFSFCCHTFTQLSITMAPQYAKNQSEGFINAIQNVAIVGVRVLRLQLLYLSYPNKYWSPYRQLDKSANSSPSIFLSPEIRPWLLSLAPGVRPPYRTV